MDKQYSVYILRCADDSYYVGVTSYLEARIWGHYQGLVPGYTHDRRPVELVYTESTNDIGGAIAREKQLKRWSRKKKEALIEGEQEKLHQSSQGKGRWHRRWLGGRKKILHLL